tara:strand:+ start:447 stop:758 length:312 start_codon:yes stop_codon:yes gene_type:complete
MIILTKLLCMQNILKINKMTSDITRTGIDHRYSNITDLNNEQLYNIEIIFYKNDVLKTLENPNTPTVCKMILIDEYYNAFHCKPTINLHAGGLFNDWDFDLHP